MKPFRHLLVCAVLLSLSLIEQTSRPPVQAARTYNTSARLSAAYGKLPLGFERNAGQTDSRVQWLARGAGYSFFLTSNEAVVRTNDAASDVLRMRLRGATRTTHWQASEALPGVSHFFRGNDTRQWRTNVKQFARVQADNVYPGIELVWYGNQQQLEYDFLLAPRADAARIAWQLEGANCLLRDADGSLAVTLASGETLRWLKPQAWQTINGNRQTIECEYVVRGVNEVAFRLGTYDTNQPLVIDPVLAYSTFLGGNAFETATSIAVDNAGSAYVTGLTTSTDFPGSSPLQSFKAAESDAFVLKLNPAGTAVVYQTWLGGSGADNPGKIAVDANGNAVITGSTFSSDFPLHNALQTTFKGSSDTFITKLNAAGSALLFSTYLGGTSGETAGGLTLDTSANVYVTGSTISADFPVQNPLQRDKQGNVLHITVNAANTWQPIPTKPSFTRWFNLIVDPKTATTFYALTERGLFKSTDSGANWTALAVLPFQSNSKLVIDSVTPTTMYAFFSRGVYKSVNGGASFTPSALTNGVRTLVIDPVTPTTLYAGVENGSIRKSTDGGATWISQGIPHPFGSQFVSVSQLAIDAQAPQTLYAISNGGVHKTTNGGTNWQWSATGLPNIVFVGTQGTIAISRSNPLVVLFSQEGIGTFRTTDGGNTWQSFRVQTDSPIPTINTLAIDPSNANLAYAATSFGVFKSTDGGATWNISSNGIGNLSTSALLLLPNTPATLFAASGQTTDAFVTKLNANGNALLYSTYLGGSGQDTGSGVSVDGAGNAYVCGNTESANFGGLASGFQTTLRGPSDAFVVKLNPAGDALLWRTFYGGDGSEAAYDLAINATGNAYITGSTTSNNLPVANALQETNRTAAGNGGTEAFVARFSADGRTLDFGTYLGGASIDIGSAIALDAAGQIYVAGQTYSRDFPLANATQNVMGDLDNFGGQDAFVSKLSPNGRSLLFSTFLGGSFIDYANDLAVDNADSIYVVGHTISPNFPLTPNALRSTPAREEAFITKFSNNADLVLALIDAPDPVMVNNPLTLTLTVTNNGPDPATGITLTPTLPSAATFNNATATQGTCTNAAPVSCSLGTLAARASAMVTLTITPTTTATLTTRANVTSASPDLNTANNAATQETRVVTTPSLYGRVSVNSAGLSDVTLAMSGAQRPVVTTNASGDYQFAELSSGGNYIVTPQRTGHVFNPPSRSFTNLTRDQRADFAAVACAFTLSQRSQSFQATGGMASVTMTATDPQCPWTARSTVPWLTLQSAASGNGSTTVRFTVAPTVTARQGSLLIGRQVFTIFQEFTACASVRLGPPPLTWLLPSGSYNGNLLLLRDFNRDGRVDLAAVSSGGPNAVELFLGLAEGGFSNTSLRPIELPGNSMQINGLRAADLNNDGLLDLVASGGEQGGAGRIWIAQGTNAGGFGARQEQTLSQGFYPTSLAVGDLNGDNRPDLAFGIGEAPFGATVINNGNGTFGTPRGLPAGGNFFSTQIDLSDLNGDSHLDVIRRDGPGFNFYQGDGRGNFSPLPGLVLPGPLVVSLGDFNNDQRPDLTWVSQDFQTAQNTLHIMLNNGLGGFVTTVKTPLPFPANFSDTSLTIADFNQDGNLDVTIKVPAGLYLFYGNGRAGFASPLFYLASGVPVTTGDYNRDGLPDLVSIEIGRRLSIVTASSSGFNAVRGFPYATEGFAQSVVVGDVNGDGLNDAVLAGVTAAWLPGLGRGTYGAPVSIPLEQNHYVAASALLDFNRDGRLDLALLQPNANVMTLLLNNGRGQVTTHGTLNVGGSGNQLGVADFNQDGTPDLVTRGQAGGLALYLGNGQGGFTPNATGLGGSEAGNIFTIGDFNGDRFPDLALPDPQTQSGQTAARVLILPGNGQGGFAAAQPVNSEAPPVQVLAADLNLDGRDDLIYSLNTFPASVNIALSNSNGGYETATKYPAEAGFPFLLQFADLNSDGKPDLLGAAANAQKLLVWQGKGDGTFNQPLVSDLPSSFTALATSDADENGSLDLLAAPTNAPVLGVFINRNNCLPAAGAVTTSAASYAAHRIANDSINALFGVGLSNVSQNAGTIPLPTTLGGVSLRLRDSAGIERLAPLFFVSPGQINYLTPAGLAPGVLTVTVLNGSNAVATGTTLLASTAPGLFSVNAAGTGLAAAVVLRVRANGAQVYESVARFEQGRFVALPIDVGNAAEQVFLLLYGTGLRNRIANGTVVITANGTPLDVLYAGTQGGLAGLDQLNVRLPASLNGRGQIELQLVVDGRAANQVSVSIK